MTKYTAADFANAQFAEHEDRRIAARLQTEEARPWESVRDFHTDEGMAADGWVPVPTKPQITESELRNVNGVGYVSGFIDGFLRSGGEIIPDPEPTNTDRLRELHQAWINECGDLTLSEYFDKHGVTAPNVKGN